MLNFFLIIFWISNIKLRELKSLTNADLFGLLRKLPKNKERYEKQLLKGIRLIKRKIFL